MTALVTTIFVTSLVGSPHCAGMCGAVVALATCSPGKTPTTQLHLAYHGGRLLTYALLGFVAGLGGALLDLGSVALGMQRTAAVLAGAAMITLGISQLLRMSGLQLSSGPMPVPGFLHRFVMRGHQRAMQFPPLQRAFGLGLLTTLLPCGWLYAFAIAAAGTGHPLYGALVMAVFWAGTVPVLTGIGAAARALHRSSGRWLAGLGAAALIVAGGYTVMLRMQLDPRGMLQELEQTEAPTEVAEMPCCHVSP